MIFDKYNLPKDVGASDKMDSARLAGLMSTFSHPLTPNLAAYIVDDNQGVRHPHEIPANNPKNFSRDQLMCLVAGLHAQGRIDICEKLYVAAIDRNYRAQNTEDDVVGSIKHFPNGADLLTPSNMMVLKIAAGRGRTLIGRVWLLIDVLFNAVFTPTREPNQLISQLMVAGPSWIRFYKAITPKWAVAIEDYWSKNAGAWRQEPELAELMIKTLGKV